MKKKIFALLFALLFLSTGFVFNFVRAQEIKQPELKSVPVQEEEIDSNRWTEKLRPRDFYVAGVSPELKERLKTYRDTLKKNYGLTPSVYSIAIEYGLVLIDLGEFEEAKKVWDRAEKDFIGDDVPKIYKAWISACEGNYSASKDIWYAVAKSKLEFSGLWLPYHLDSFLGLYLIRDYLQENDRQEIDKVVMDTAKKYGNHPKFAAILAMEYLHKGKLKKAVERLAKVLTKFPEDPTTITLLGVAQLLGGNHEESIKLFDESIKIFPYSPTAHVMKARALAALKMKKESLAEIDKAIELDQSWKDLKENKKKFLLAKSYLREEKVKTKKLEKNEVKERVKESVVPEVPRQPEL